MSRWIWAMPWPDCISLSNTWKVKPTLPAAWRDMDRLMLDTLRQMDGRVANNRNGITGIPTGLRDLDRLTAGWQRGDLHIIAARPSVGKTAFALHLHWRRDVPGSRCW